MNKFHGVLRAVIENRSSSEYGTIIRLCVFFTPFLPKVEVASVEKKKVFSMAWSRDFYSEKGGPDPRAVADQFLKELGIFLLADDPDRYKVWREHGKAFLTLEEALEAHDYLYLEGFKGGCVEVPVEDYKILYTLFHALFRAHPLKRKYSYTRKGGVL